jgi:hypothetical protein
LLHNHFLGSRYFELLSIFWIHQNFGCCILKGSQVFFHPQYWHRFFSIETSNARHNSRFKTIWNLGRNHIDGSTGCIGTVLNLTSAFGISKACMRFYCWEVISRGWIRAGAIRTPSSIRVILLERSDSFLHPNVRSEAKTFFFLNTYTRYSS